VCKSCKYAVLPSQVNSHLRHKMRHNYNRRQREQVTEEIQAMNGLFQDEEDLKGFQFPSPTRPPIPELNGAKKDGLKCRKCRYICRNERRMRVHCEAAHEWENPRSGGRPSYKKRQVEEERPWMSGVHCQQFFIQGPKSQLFEVMREAGEEGIKETREEIHTWETIERLTTERLKHIEQKEKESIKRVDENKEPNPWLKRVGWATHLAGKNPEKLRGTVEPVETTKEPMLQAVVESFRRVVQAAQSSAVREVVGIHTLFEVNRKDMMQKPTMPFHSAMGDDTLKKYSGFWIQLLCYLYRTQEDEEFRDRPDYTMTSEQEGAYDELVEEAQRLVERESSVREGEGNARDEGHEEFEQIDRLCLQLCMTLLDHELCNSEYESAIISGLAVLGFREDGGWLNAEDYTTKYSGVIKIARMLVVHCSYVEQQDEFESKRRIMSEEQARAQTEPIFDIVRRRVRRFMTLVSESSKPTPMDWIYESRTYGMKIRYSTTAEGVIEWVGDQVRYQQIKFNMAQLKGMVHGLVEETRRDLMDLMMVKMNEDGEAEGTVLPMIDWSKLHDNAGEEKVGWSFLQDTRNALPVEGRWWLLRRVAQESMLQQQWIRKDTREHDSPYRMEAITEYHGRIEEFQEKLLMIMHIIGGQPARASELVGMRFANTKQGGLRNIFIDRGMMVFMTTYHKNYQSSGRMKIIHRYLPREAGELLFRYLWLVLPFWQAVQAVTEKADQLSPFIWSDAAQKEERKDEDSEQREGLERQDEGYICDSSEYRTVHRGKQWTSERMRKVMQKQSEKWMGVRLNISAWRHIAIAISRRYLRGRFVDDAEDEAVDHETFDEDNIEGDSPWDLQAGHGTHVAGMIYARELRLAPGETMGRQDMFRQISQEWHRFLEFPSSMQGFGVSAGMKRPRSEWEHIGREVQFHRFKKMCHVNIHGKLKALMGPEARFRGIQEEAMQAIMTGKSPVVGVMGTGGGKSLLFMLPAFCVPKGTTIVIVPLSSLQEDLERRCKDGHIECVQWSSSRPHETASIVLVTPEAAMTKTFSTFVNGLAGRYQLDRVVMDECHVVLDSSREFRPKMRRLGAEMIQMGVQMIYLTATLPPRDEEEFFQAVEVPRGCVHMFRMATTRRNIRYQVCEVTDEDATETICRLVKEKSEQYPAPAKIVIYGGSVNMTVALGEALGCATYHHQVDSRSGKARRMKELMDGSSRIIVATNALGLGVDIPDIRVVIHAQAPFKLRDYAQESGRAGRDGVASEAIIVHQPVEDGRFHRSWVSAEDEDVEEFVAGYSCRRVVMDRVMDGHTNRVMCEEGEERCDVCQQIHETGRDPEVSSSPGLPAIDGAEKEEGPGLEARFDSRLGVSSQFQSFHAPTQARASSIAQDDAWFSTTPVEAYSSPVAEHRRMVAHRKGEVEKAELQMEMGFDEQEHQRRWMQSMVTRETRQQACEVQELERHLREWNRKCPLCHLRGGRQDHELEECARPEAEGIRCEVENMRKGVRYEPFSSCFHCGVPQAICTRWQQKEEQGWWEEMRGGRCQYSNVLIGAIATMLSEGEDGVDEEMYEWMTREGVNIREEKQVYGWLGGRVEWGGIEASKMVQVFHKLARVHVV
jgi:superfamily II DNA helicase RecQ